MRRNAASIIVRMTNFHGTAKRPARRGFDENRPIASLIHRRNLCNARARKGIIC
jgi:hypothetical protein